MHKGSISLPNIHNGNYCVRDAKSVSPFVLQCEYNEDCFNERILIKFHIDGKFVDPLNFI